MKKLLLGLVYVFASLSIFAHSFDELSVADNVYSLSQHEVHDTLELILSEEASVYQSIEILNENLKIFTLNIDVLEVDFPANWQVSFCSYATHNSWGECAVGNNQVLVENYDWLELSYSILGGIGSEAGTANVRFALSDVNNPTCIDTVNFSLTLDASNLPDASTGFMVSSNEAHDVYPAIDPGPYSFYNNIEIYNTNDSHVELGWKIIDQSAPDAWDYDYYHFILPNHFFENEAIPTEGTFVLNANEYQFIEMGTGIQNINGTPGTRSVDILIYDLNDSLNYNETLSFQMSIDIKDTGNGFMVFNPESTEYFDIFSPDEPAHFHHIPVEIANNNIFQELSLAWEVINYEKPEEWIMDDEMMFMSSVDNGQIPHPTLGQSGEFTLAAGDYALIEYFIHDIQHNNVSGVANLQVLIYDLQDSAATAQVLSWTSVLNVPQLGTGFNVWENYSGSIHYLENPDEPLFMYLSPLYINNESENIVEIAWEKLSHSIPSEWTTNYDFNAHYDYYNNEIPNSGEFSLYAFEQAYFALNFNEVLTNGVAGETELQILVYDKNDSLNYNEILTFRSSVCVQDSNASIIIPPSQNSFCAGEMITLEAAAGLQNIQWMNGSSSPSITIPAQEYVYLYAEDANGCPQNQELFLTIAYPYNESICVVSVDENSGKNTVIWEKTAGQQTMQYNIYKETEQANQYEFVGSQPFGELSQFVDEASNPNVASSRYKIAVVNECGAESPLSSEHKTMHLTINVSNNSDINLIWDRYEGFDYPTFNILRGSSSYNMQLIAQRPSNTFTYTDIAPPSGMLFYQIEIVYPGGCTPTSHAVSGTRSNVADNLMVATERPTREHEILIFPNPFDGELNIKKIPTDVFALEISDVSGKILMQEKINSSSLSLDVAHLPNGVYFVSLQGKQNYFSKIIK